MVRALPTALIARNFPDGDRDPFDAACRPELAALPLEHVRLYHRR